ncbi:hypothetical protein PGTUg99_021077 [Puccinia graminis f. sp. tritici]|uniref:Uncharacterized protein n=1 Tax=Puccinia graminis f. sp. tritici TaxID=56615 RepID=A0A5B0SJS5_PUCGR|nr:hypothetical protein PGTUg99_021077 [Puccinia graminis f. sp. tritici]
MFSQCKTGSGNACKRSRALRLRAISFKSRSNPAEVLHTPDLRNRQVRLHTSLSPTLHTPSCKLYPFEVRLHATLDLVTASLHPPSSSPS